MVISGFHLVQDSYSEEDIQTIKDISVVCNQYQTMYYTGHCTGQVAFDEMKKILKDKLKYMHAGDQIKK